MRIASFRIQNYKAFRDTGDVPLKAGVNIVVGKNDAGKSALLEAISLTHGTIPHRSAANLPSRDTPVNSNNFVHLDINFDSSELMAHFSRRDSINLPLKTDAGTTRDAFLAILEKGGVLRSEYRNSQLLSAHFAGFSNQDPIEHFQFLNRKAPRGLELIHNASGGRIVSDYGHGLADDLKAKMYAFKAERLNIGESPVQANPILSANAGNLADVLNQLMTSNPARWEKLMGHVKTVFPHITEVTSQMVSNTMVRISVWHIHRTTERSDLAVPLAQSGTGIGQVLAMLYVVVTADTPRVILIDEPQSFLHPGAVRKLLEILREYEHQYIITTHTPMALDLRASDNVLLVSRLPDGAGSTVEVIDPSKAHDLQRFLLEVGARLGDVFGVDAILWVEGKTEEQCFPLLVQRLTNTHMRGVKILGVVATDELTNKHANRVFDIYSRLSVGQSLLPPAVGFVFDPEGRSEQVRAEIEKKSGGQMHWLPRRMYENYLIDAKAIAALLTHEDQNSGSIYSDAQILALIRELSADAKYFEGMATAPEFDTSDWLEKMHGANLLGDLFAKATGARVEYRKVIQGMELTEYILNHNPPLLQPLADWIANLIQAGASVLPSTTAA